MTPENEKLAKKVGLAAAILLAPGGFILGAALLAERYRKRDRAKPRS